tara:strand:- start:330 stop:701 length:372 start_codon:yes stop_codon:yes gene_type:complete
MAFVTGTEYTSLADKISDARTRLTNTVQDVFDVVYEVVQYNSIDKEVDLLSPFFSVYQVANDSYKQTSTLDAGIRALNNHILRRSEHSTLDAYLTSEGVQVTQTFADLSTSLGFPITESSNII